VASASAISDKSSCSNASATTRSLSHVLELGRPPAPRTVAQRRRPRCDQRRLLRPSGVSTRVPPRRSQGIQVRLWQRVERGGVRHSVRQSGHPVPGEALVPGSIGQFRHTLTIQDQHCESGQRTAAVDLWAGASRSSPRRNSSTLMQYRESTAERATRATFTAVSMPCDQFSSSARKAHGAGRPRYCPRPQDTPRPAG
jgi:hypothetical protein